MVGRLFQIIYILMEKESVTAAELAQKLEVSVRTINRDIEKLSEARIPIYATRGRSGGISLLSDFVLDKKVLSEEEKSSILSSIRVMGAVSYEDEKQALSRLEEFFGKEAQDWIEIEFDCWGEGKFEKEKFRLLKDAILNHKMISFEYASHNEIKKRTVKPYQLVFRSQAWYIYAFCELRQDYRYFKLSRINKLSVSEERFLPEKIEEKNHYVEYKDTFEVVFAIDKKMAYRAYDELPIENMVEEDDRLIFSIPNAERSWFFDYILSYGEYAEVISPDEIRKEITQKVEKLYAKYNIL